LAGALALSPALPAQTAPAAAASAGDLFVVLPFEHTGRDPKFAWIGEGLAELFAERLAADGRWVLPRGEWAAALEKRGLPPTARLTRATVLKVAQDLDADFVIAGEYFTDGAQLHLTAHVLKTSPPALSSAINEKGSLADLMEMQARAGWHVMRFADPFYPINLPAYLQKLPRRRLDAFEQYVRGLLASQAARLRYLREAARLEPEWAQPAFALGEAFYAARNCEPALHWLSKVPAESGRGLEAAFYAGVCHLLRNEPAPAESAFAELVADFTRHSNGSAPPEALNNLAIAESRQGKWQEAAGHWQRVQQASPEESDYWFNAAAGALRAGEPAAAVRPLRELLKGNPEHTEGRALLLAALERAGRASEAALLREECGSSDCGASPAVRAALAFKGGTGTPADPFAKLERISTAVDAQEWAQVRAAAHRTPSARAAARVEHHEIHLTRARQALADGRLDDALREFSETVLLAGDSVEARMGLAEVHQRRGQADDAIRELRAALWGGENAGVRVRLAEIYAGQGQINEARAELRAALQAEPNHAGARRLLDSLANRRGGGPR
jgi:tetratricopeptide (TPR) repeat protein